MQLYTSITLVVFHADLAWLTCVTVHRQNIVRVVPSELTLHPANMSMRNQVLILPLVMVSDMRSIYTDDILFRFFSHFGYFGYEQCVTQLK